MYSNNLITKFINKYYLNGLINGAQLVSENGNLSTVFRNSEGNLRGEIRLTDAKLPGGIIGLYYTGKLLSMMSILSDDINIEYKGKSDDGSIVSLEMNDLKGKRIAHKTTMLELIDYDGKKGQVKDYEINIDITNNEVVGDLLKGFSAIETSTMSILKKNDLLYAVFGNLGTNVDQIEINLEKAKVDSDFDNDDFITFPAGPIKEILSVNNKAFEKASLNVSTKGLMQLLFVEGNITSEYWIRKNS